jgi:hypothetical protein
MVPCAATDGVMQVELYEKTQAALWNLTASVIIHVTWNPNDTVLKYS